MRVTGRSALVGAMLALGCGGASAEVGGAVAAPPPEKAPDGVQRVGSDGSLCEIKDPKAVETSETAGPGAVQPNVRRVWRSIGTGSDRRKVLVCREVDTNLDGRKDTVRFYNDDGQTKEERSDTNFDGKIDTWNIFAKGRLVEERFDRNYDGHADEWKIYSDGKLIRIKRDADFDGKPDVWEMYRKGRLERMGIDIDRDGRVDRWDQDTEWRRKLEQAARRQSDEAERKKQEDAEKRRKEAGAEAAAEVEKEDAAADKQADGADKPKDAGPKDTPKDAGPKDKPKTGDKAKPAPKPKTK
jgi:hypothetical protein